MESFFQKLNLMIINREVEGKLTWNESKCSKFSVRSLYFSLSRGYSAPFPASIVWRAWASLKVSFFTWEASWDRILTLD